MIIILAGTADDAKREARKCGLQPPEWIYAADPSVARGRIVDEVIVCESAIYRDDYEALHNAAYSSLWPRR